MSKHTYTHFAAVNDSTIVATRTSTSRTADCPVGHKFGPYSHAVMITTRTVTIIDGGDGDQVEFTDAVTTWHGGEKNAQAGLRAAKVGHVRCVGANGVSWIDRGDKIHYLKPEDKETVKVITIARAVLLPVVILESKPKIGQKVTMPVTCPGCSGAGLFTDDPQVLKCEKCGGFFNSYDEPVTMEQAMKFVRFDTMLPNAGPDGQFYFDLNISTEWNGQPQVKRVHGWADAKTKRVVQFG